MILTYCVKVVLKITELRLCCFEERIALCLYCLQGAYRIKQVVLHDHLCPFSMSFQYHLMEWISNRSDCRTHMLINHLLLLFVELPRLLCTVVGRKPANPPQEGNDIHGIRLGKFLVGQGRLPKGFPSLLSPRRTFPQEMFSIFFNAACFTYSIIF